MGADYKRPATEEEIKRMGELIEYGMREGAFGFSSAPGSNGPEFYGNTDESIALAKAMMRYGGIYITGLRDNDNAVDSIREVIRISQAAKVAVQVSIGAPAAASKSAQMLAEIDKARTQGIDIAADLDSYDGGVRALLQNPWVMFAGAFPSVFARYVRDEKILTLERAIRKMTGLPASRIGLKERGVLRKGASADVVVFDPQSVGIKHVFVNGTIVLKDGQATGEHPGLALR
jgi:N-acyl-D-aspartate/D-glutamate deacylase